MFCGTIFTLLSEGVKYVVFLNIEPCSSDQYWENGDVDIETSLNKCTMSRGAYLSLTGILFYLMATISLAWSISHSNEFNITQDLDYDDISMPSFLQSIGESLTSKFSKGSSMISSKSDSVGRRYSGPGPGPTRFKSREMTPITEYDDDDRT